MTEDIFARVLPIGPVNVNPTERMLSAALGGALLLFGLNRRGASGTAMALAGGTLLMRGATGHCPMYQLIQDRRGETEMTRETRRVRRDYAQHEIRRPETAEVLSGPHRAPRADRDKVPAEDKVEEGSEMSFPASDPPAYMSGSAVPGGDRH